MITRHRRRTPHTPGLILPLVLVALSVAAACSADPGPAARSGDATAGRSPAEPGPSASGPGSPSSVPARPSASSKASGSTPVHVTVGDRTFDAELYDNPTAHDLADQLPMTVTMDDLHRSEKTGPLPRPLTTDGVPRGSDPDVNEIGYYAPGRDLVLYYGDVGYFDGIVRIGRFAVDIDGIADLPDGIRVTVERA